MQSLKEVTETLNAGNKAALEALTNIVKVILEDPKSYDEETPQFDPVYASSLINAFTLGNPTKLMGMFELLRFLIDKDCPLGLITRLTDQTIDQLRNIEDRVGKIQQFSEELLN